MVIDDDGDLSDGLSLSLYRYITHQLSIITSGHVIIVLTP